MAHIISVYNFKGGVGKTTSVYHLAFNWASAYKILIVDCDPQKNLTSSLLRNTQDKQTIFNYTSAFLHNSQPEIKPEVVSPNIHIIPGDHRVVDLESNNQFIEFGLGIIQKMLFSISSRYDLIILDCPSYFGKTVKYFLGNSEYLLIPATPDSFSLRGVLELIRQLKGMEKVRKLHILGMFYNRYRGHFLHHRKMRVLARRIFGNMYIDSPIRNTVKISESIDKKGFFDQQIAESHLDTDYERLGVKIIEKLLKSTSEASVTKYYSAT